MNLLWDYNHIDASSKQRWCNFYNIFLPRLKRLDSTHLNLMLRVAKFLGISPELLKISIPPTQMTPEKVIILRIVQFWVFNDTIIQFDPSKVTLKKSPKGFYLDVLHNSDPMDTNMLESVLRRDSQPFEVVGQKETIQKGNFQFKVNGDRIDQNGERADQAFSVGFEDRLLSYSSEKALSLAWVKYNDKVLVYYREQLKNTPDFVDVVAIPLDQLSNDMSFLVARAPSGKNRRGRAERPCGLWTISQPRPGSEENMSGKTWIKICCVKTKSSTKKLETLELKLIKLTKENSIASISIQFGCLAHPIDDKPVQFTIFARGPEPGVSNTDLKDMMAAPVTSSRSSSCRQKLLFPVAPTSRMVFSERDNPSAKVESTSWSRPLIDCIPEAIRVLSVLASGRRKDHRIRFPKEGTNEAKEPEVFNDLYLDPDVTKISHRWTRFNASAKVFVDTSSVPASAIPMEGEKILYCTCANALEVNGGGMRVEGLTLLPPGREFLLLCRLTFGIDERKHLDDGSIFQKSIEFVKAKGKDASTLREKVRQAIQFDDLAKKSGEKLECFPDNVALLLSVFEGIDKCSSTTWKGLETNPLIAHNLRTNQMAYKVSRPSLNSEQWKNDSELDVSRDDVGSIGNRMVRDSGDTPPNSLETAVASRNNAKRSTPIIHHTLIGNGLQILTQFTEEDVTVTKNLFLQTLPPGQKVDERDIPSSNILSLVVSQVSTDVDMSVAGSDWKFYTTSIAGKSWYFAFFSTNGLAFVERKSKGMPSWLKSTSATNARPDTIEGARRCIPSGKIVLKSKAKVFTYDKRNVLVFDSLELAIRMESAFWLERQFCSWKFHWYENMDIEKMVNRLQRLCLVTNS